MHSLYELFRAKRGIGASFYIGIIICSLLGWLPFTTPLYGYPANAKAPAPPANPSSLSANSFNNSRIDLTWTDNSSDEDDFKIEIKIGAAGAYSEIATVAANATSYSSTGLDASTQYFYRVFCFQCRRQFGLFQ